MMERTKEQMKAGTDLRVECCDASLEGKKARIAIAKKLSQGRVKPHLSLKLSLNIDRFR